MRGRTMHTLPRTPCAEVHRLNHCLLWLPLPLLLLPTSSSSSEPSSVFVNSLASRLGSGPMSSVSTSSGRAAVGRGVRTLGLPHRSSSSSRASSVGRLGGSDSPYHTWKMEGNTRCSSSRLLYAPWACCPTGLARPLLRASSIGRLGWSDFPCGTLKDGGEIHAHH